MRESLFGTAPADLEAGARNAVEICLAIKPGERVALIADEASGEVAASIASALDDARAPWQGILIERVSPRPLTGAPKAVLDPPRSPAPGLLCIPPTQGDLGARKAARTA